MSWREETSKRPCIEVLLSVREDSRVRCNEDQGSPTVRNPPWSIEMMISYFLKKGTPENWLHPLSHLTYYTRHRTFLRRGLEGWNLPNRISALRPIKKAWRGLWANEMRPPKGHVCIEVLLFTYCVLCILLGVTVYMLQYKDSFLINLLGVSLTHQPHTFLWWEPPSLWWEPKNQRVDVPVTVFFGVAILSTWNRPRPQVEEVGRL